FVSGRFDDHVRKFEESFYSYLVVEKSCATASQSTPTGPLDLRFPQERNPWSKDTCAYRKAQVNLQKNLAVAIPTFLRRGQSFQEPDWKQKKRRNVELGSRFGRFLTAKIEFSYGAGQTVNLLALRLQWFESTPTQASPRAILQM